MEERYRADYNGEMVVVSVKQINGKKEYNREWIDNPLKLESISGRATCVSDGPSAHSFHLKRLENHRGGLLGTLAMHVYATDDMYKQFLPNFLTTFNSVELNDLINLRLTEKVIVYTSTQNCLKHPGEFYIIPYTMKMTPELTNLWLACFDGHNEVFMLGYDEYDDFGHRRNKLVSGALEIMSTYSNIKFTYVVRQGEMPKEWRYLRNVQQMTPDEYKSYCDIS